MGAFNVRICVLAACLLMAAQASGYTMEQMCEQWSGEGYIGNPSSCRAWGYCKGQKLVSWNTCPGNSVFNPQTESCVNASTAVCTTSAVQTCASAASPMYVANPMNCTEYGYCDGKGGISYGNCGAGGVYSASSRSCVWGPTCPQDSICRFMPSNIFVGDPDNCGSYINCLDGYGVSTKCANSQFYNAATGNCQSANPCTDDNSDSGSSGGQFSVGDKDAKICISGFDNATVLADKTYRYVSDNATCFGFFYCASANATGVWNQCPTGTQFDAARGQCVSPAAFACKFNRCGNVNNPFMAAVDSECQSYTSCSSGAAGTCPTGHYYDEVHNICSTTKPTYAICETKATL